MSKNDLFRIEFDYEEDDYDRLDEYNRSNDKGKVYTNKSTLRNPEFDYEEDAYEPEKTDEVNL